MVKTPNCNDKLSKQKDVWIEEECTTFSKKTGLIRRSGKSGRKKWNDEQKSDPKHKSFTPEEEELVIKLHAAIGSRWPIIAQQLPGRSDNDVKILWNSKLRKKLSAMGIDPVTHKPFSQILADYGNIGAFPKARPRFSSLSRDLRDAIVISKPDQQSHNQKSFENHFWTSQMELSDDHHPSYDLYSQLQAVNLVTETSNYPITNMQQQFIPEFGSSSSSLVKEELSSFSWSDFLLDDAFQTQNVDQEQENMGIFSQCDGNIIQENEISVGFEGHKEECDTILVESFEGSSSSSNSSFVEAMLERQDEMFPQFPADLYEENFQ